MKQLGWIIIFLCFGGLFSYNICLNDSFWEVSVSSLLTLGVTIFFSYWLVQNRNDKRKKHDKIDSLLYKIQGIIQLEEFIKSDSEDIQRKNLILQRSIANKLTYLKQGCVKEKQISELIEKLVDEYERFRTFYGEHYTDLDYMNKSQKELRNYISQMDDIADKIHMKLL